MTDIWNRLLNAFFEFRNAKGHYSYVHERYRDRVVSTDSPPRSAWLLHDHIIAKLKRTDNGLYVLWLSNAGYDTPTTVSRLNMIVEEAYDRLLPGVYDRPHFRLKYRYLGSSPIATYVEYQEKTYLLTGREVKITFFPLQKRADVDIYGREILLFKDAHEPEVNRKLRKIRRLRGEISTLMAKISQISGEVENMVKERYADTLDFIDGVGLRYFGVFAEYLREPEYSLIVNTLKNIRDELRLIYDEDPERMRANAMLVM
jgi:hypothetical protein